jgi:hypothetical protein
MTFGERNNKMSESKTIRLIQTVHVSHNETIERSWYDVVERTIVRSLDEQGNILSDEVVEEQVIEEGLGVEEEIIATDEDTDADEIIDEVVDEEEC